MKFSFASHKWTLESKHEPGPKQTDIGNIYFNCNWWLVSSGCIWYTEHKPINGVIILYLITFMFAFEAIQITSNWPYLAS